MGRTAIVSGLFILGDEQPQGLHLHPAEDLREPLVDVGERFGASRSGASRTTTTAAPTATTAASASASTAAAAATATTTPATPTTATGDSDVGDARRTDLR